MNRIIRIGTRDSELATWQANLVKQQLALHGYSAELVFIKSEGDLNLTSPLYAMGVQGVFTRNLDIALLNNRIDIAVHSMKDVPIQLPVGIIQAAVLERASHKDVIVPRVDGAFTNDFSSPATIATSSIRRIAQWLHRYPRHSITDLRGNVNTRLRKLAASDWHGAVFAAAGLQRIGLMPSNAIELDWMLPAPAQGAILVVCRENESDIFEACQHLDHESTALCTHAERQFLQALMGGCSTPISALATIENDMLHFRGNITSPDGKLSVDVETSVPAADSTNIGKQQAIQILEKGGRSITEQMKQNG